MPNTDVKEIINQANCLQTVEIKNYPFTEDCVKQLASKLIENQYLKRLIIKNCSLTDIFSQSCSY